MLGKVWTTKTVTQYKRDIELGRDVPKPSPFWENKPEWRQGDIVFEYTKDELKELLKCRKDIIYFADNYAYSMTDEGIRKITLRDYQKDMLRQFQDERFNIVLASRQIGKCQIFTQKLNIKTLNGKKLNIPAYKLYFNELRNRGKYTIYSFLKEILYKSLFMLT